MKILYCVTFFFVLSFASFAQNWQKIDSVFAPSGISVRDFSAPVWGDLDADGDYDLVLGNIDSEIEYFENIGTAQQPGFKKDPQMFSSIYAGGYQYTNADYPALADLDNDRDLDLVISGYNGLILYENAGDTTSPVWVKIDSLFGPVNISIGTDGRPAFADLDADGDLDLVVGIGESLFGGPTAGISMGFRNTGDAGNPVFVRDDALIIGVTDVGLNAYPAFGDLDADGDLDLVMGRDGSQMYYYKNNGTKFNPSFVRESTTLAVVETVNYWKDPSLCDIDADNDLDLIYGTDNGILYYYKNQGTPSAPQFQLNTEIFHFIKSDGFSTPSFADYDGDGDFDMLSGSMIGDLYYARNDGNYSSPRFKAASTVFTTINPGFRSAPRFIDFDKDGDYDIISGFSSGYLDLYKNNGGTFAAFASRLAGIKVSYGSIPAFADINGDGHIDVLVGSDDRDSTRFYLNDGKNIFTVTAGYFNGVSFSSSCSPAFCDIDSDGDFDLFIGKTFGTVDYYKNTGSSTAPQWTRDTQLMSGIEVNQNAHPSFSDLDGDGRWDLILGEYDGNFTFYKNLFAVVSVEDDSYSPGQFGLYQNYPNPFNPSTVISFNLTQPENVQLKIYDLTGREIAVLIDGMREAGMNRIIFNSEGLNLASGMYIYTIKTGNNFSSRKMLLLK